MLLDGDANIEEFAMEGKADVFISDIAAAALMCSSKAGFSWDLKIKKIGGMVFIDKRDEKNMLDW